MANWLQRQWLAPTFWQVLLIPLSWIFSLISSTRRKLYKTGCLKSYALPVPVIVVGNINVGGTGKTPLVIWLAIQLKLAGYQPGIISRGYGGRARQVTEVFANSNPQQVGDEPVLIAKRSNCPMFVHANRFLAGQSLLKEHPECDVILSDDGLQHYRLQRDFEIAVVNSSFMQGGKARLLPAGPLREKVTRLQTVDAIVESGSTPNFDFNLNGALPPVFKMQLHGDMFEPLDGTPVKKTASDFVHKSLIALAGIGNPERFFNQLTSLGLQFQRKVFADHHAFTLKDLSQFSGETVLMTEKDAVKCQAFPIVDAWYLPVSATLSSATQASLIALILQKLRI